LHLLLELLQVVLHGFHVVLHVPQLALLVLFARSHLALIGALVIRTHLALILSLVWTLVLTLAIHGLITNPLINIYSLILITNPHVSINPLVWSDLVGAALELAAGTSWGLELAG